MTRASPKSARRVLPPDEVRDILAGIGHARPAPQANSALPAPMTTTPTPLPTESVQLDDLVADLLRGIDYADRPALVEQARVAGQSQIWMSHFNRWLETAVRHGQGDWVLLFERVQKLRERESAIHARAMLVLQMFREHRLEVRAHVTRRVDRKGRRSR